MSHFSLSAFKIYNLSLNFNIFTMICPFVYLSFLRGHWGLDVQININNKEKKLAAGSHYFWLVFLHLSHFLVLLHMFVHLFLIFFWGSINFSAFFFLLCSSDCVISNEFFYWWNSWVNFSFQLLCISILKFLFAPFKIISIS